MIGEVPTALQMPPLDQPVRNQTMTFPINPFPMNTPFPSMTPHYQQITPNNLHTQSSPIFTTHILTLPFPHQIFYGPNRSHYSPYNSATAHPYTITLQYNSHGVFSIPNQDCLSHSVTSPFAKELLDYKILNTKKLPHLKIYNGTTNLDSHIDTYEWTMTSLTPDERFWCMYFPTTLDGNTRTWFKTLRTGSIYKYNFGQLKYIFLTNLCG